MTKKNILILSGIGVIMVAGAIYQIGFSNKEPAFNYEEVKRSDIYQEVSVSGNVTKGKEVSLNFSGSGKLEKKYVQVGDEVEEGQKLAELDNSQLAIQFQASSAQLRTAQINLEKLVAGASAEDVSLSRTALQNAQESYRAAQQSYNDTLTLVDASLSNLYKSSLNDLAESNADLYSALIFLQSNLYASDSRDVEKVRVESEKMSASYQDAKNSLAQAQAGGNQTEIDVAIEKTKLALEVSRDVLLSVKETWQFRSSASAVQKSSLDDHQTYINLALSSVGAAQDAISLAKANNQSSINTASAAMSSAQGQMNIVQGNLDKLLADPRQEDLRLAQAQVDQAQSQVNLLGKQIRDAVLKAPAAGKISQVNKEEGEMVSSLSTQDFIVLMPKEPFQVDVNIPEVDVGKIEIGNLCTIDLDAFSEEEFSGKVIKVDPGQTVISGVVYYKTTISLDSEDPKIKQGMTANVTIVTASRAGVLNIPQRAIVEKDGKKMVRVVEGDKFNEVEVQTGLKGVSGGVEITSGLKEGDKVVTFIKGE
jgi:HlyD family secretion protein